MAARCFGCLIISVIILIIGELTSHTRCHALPPEYSITEAADLKVYNICCIPQKCAISIPCENFDILEKIASEVEEHKTEYGSVQININTSKVSLNRNVRFSNLSSLIINGDTGNNISNIFCEPSANTSAGIVLSDVQSITLNNLKLTGCGSVVKNSMFKNKNHDFISALTMVRCRDVQINRLIITQSIGTGLTILNHQEGRVSVKLSTFQENSIPQSYIRDSPSPIFGGGGLYVRLDQIQGISYSPMTFQFSNCTFENNTARSKRFLNLFTNDMQKGYGGEGGGVYLSIGRTNGISNVNVSFLGCTFKGNRAQYGGGVYYYSHRSSQYSVSMKNSVLFDSCRFDRNIAHIGSAIDITPNIYHKLSSGYSIVPTFKNCEFLENHVFPMNDSEEIRSNHYTWNTPGLGTIRTSHQNINFQGHNNFERNWGTALYVVNAIVNFQKSSASFVNNIGLQGGAVALVGSSTLIVGPHDYVFHNNSAYYQGGAIYVLLIDHFDIEVSQSCFIEYADDVGDVEIDNIDHTDNEWKANITFTDNHILRGMAGCTIFATSLYSCQVINNGTKDQPEYVILHPNVALERRGLKINDHDFNCTHQVATDGAKFHIGSATPLMIIPGKEYSHNITATDDLGQDIHNVPFRMVIHDPDDTTYLLFNNVTSSTTYIEDEIQLMGNPDQTEHAVLRLHTLSARQIFIEANITLVECPPGFVLVNESRPRCVCNEKAPVGIFNCNLKEFRSHLLPGYWAGLLEGELVTSTCPFCEYDNKFMSKSEFDITLPQSYSELNKAICGNRNGTVCGICQNNYTVHFHSPNFKCKSKKPVGCKLGWLFYILSEIVPVTVVFIIVLVFNISFTSGTISGFILFSQLLVTLDINASGIIKFSYSLKHNLNDWEEGYLMLYGVFNLDFFNSERLSFCIMTNASALDMIAFKYVTILYTLLLILSVIWIMNKCGGRCCGRVCRITTVRSSVVQGLSSFLVMCYTRCVQVSMNLLNPVHLKVERDSLFNPLTRVWLNGDMIYFSEAHLRYAFPALFCLFTIGVLPPVLLLCYPLLNKVPAFFGCNDINVDCLFCHKVSVSYLKPLLDSFQSCFRDNMRFFAGLYFLYRWIILLIYVVTHSYSVYYITIIGGLVGILTLHAICQPYVKRSHNIIDILLLANLIIISCLSFYNYHRNHFLRGVKHSTTAPAAIVQLVLIYLPLIALCAYILMIVCKMVKKRKKIVFYASDKLVPRRANRLREFIRTISDENDDSDEVELTHDQLMDEDVSFYENVCNYFKASGDTEMVLLNT